MSADFRSIILAMASEMPDARVSTIVRLAVAVENAKPPTLDDAEALGKWAKRQPEVAAEIARDRKINAIKELRALTHASLLQSKNAIDCIWVTS